MFDPSGDFEDIVDGLEAVTLAVSGLSDQAIAKAHRNQVTNAEVEASNGLARMGDTIWIWSTAEVAIRATLGSTITDADSRIFTILGIDLRVLSNTWAATCRELAVEARADTLIDIQQATYSKGEHGSAVPSWADVYTDVRARIQPFEQVPEVEHDRDETERRYRIILETELVMDTIGSDWRVVDADGDLYIVERYEQAERIDTLPVIVALFTSTSSSGS